MYLKTLTLSNFRSFDQAEILLNKDLNILVGENNGGKSNAIDAIRLLTTPLGGRREIYCESTDIRFGCASQQFELTGHFDDLSHAQRGRMFTASADHAISSCVFGVRYDESNGQIPPRPTLWAGFQKGTPEPGCHEMVRHVYLPPLRDAKRALASGNPTRIYALLKHFLEGGDPEKLAKELGRASDNKILERIGGAVEVGLGALTAGVRRQSAALGFASDEKLIDIARDLRFKLADHGVEPEDLRYSGHGYANLLYMATIAIELEKVKNAELTIFLVEEPEAHLHPQLQAAVLSFLDEQAEKSRKSRIGDMGPAGELQVIVATHSPNLAAWVESRKLVFFRSLLPACTTPNNAASGEAFVGTETAEPRPRRVTRCIPLSTLALKDIERRKIDRYLDVTKSAMLFGGRILLAEGIAETLLLPVIARKIVLKSDADRLRLFRSAVFVSIDGVDFEPYTKLLLSPHEGVRIADRVVVLTDGDGSEEADGLTTPGMTRKSMLETEASKLGAQNLLDVVINDFSLESELVRAGNAQLLKAVFVQLHPRLGGQWDAAIALAGAAQANAIQSLFAKTRKGDFAQLLAEDINNGKEFHVPAYLKRAIECLTA